jgi:fermentation-respiration switch protein FrsA (DUF1100 family)
VILEGLIYFGKLIIGLYAILMAVLYFSQSKLLYYPNLPSRQLTTTPKSIDLPFESVNLRTTDDESIHGWYVPASNERATLLFFHGNAGNISHRLMSLKIFHQLNLSVLIFDYRGYGQSTGSPSEKGTYRDAQAALDYLIAKRKIPLDNIVFFGRSLGAAIASQLATRHQPKAIILESSFTSVPDMAAQLLPVFPMRWLSRYSYNNLKNLQSVTRPVLIIHSPDDEIIPFKHGQKLYDAANEPKTFLKIRGSHNEGFYESGQTYVSGIDHFLNKYL